MEMYSMAMADEALLLFGTCQTWVAHSSYTYKILKLHSILAMRQTFHICLFSSSVRNMSKISTRKVILHNYVWVWIKYFPSIKSKSLGFIYLFLFKLIILRCFLQEFKRLIEGDHANNYKQLIRLWAMIVIKTLMNIDSKNKTKRSSTQVKY